MLTLSSSPSKLHDFGLSGRCAKPLYSRSDDEFPPQTASWRNNLVSILSDCIYQANLSVDRLFSAA